jgi:hypothetical protein
LVIESGSQVEPRADDRLLGHALAYARRGWSIIPAAGKKPCCRWSQYQERRADEAALRRLFARSGITGLAVILGPVSGNLVARDYDDAGSYHRWAGAHPHIAGALPTVKTARGFHVYFRGGTSRITTLNDGELRGNGYCLLPPSLHPDGAHYRWLVPLPAGDLPDIDPSVAGLCNTEDRATTEDRDNTDTQTLPVSAPSSVLQDAEQAIIDTLPITLGQRNRCLFRLARELKAITPAAEFGHLRPIVERWHQRALPVIATKPFLETWADFVQAWRRVRVPAGQGALDLALQRAAAAAPPERALTLYGGGPIVLLVALCCELQHINGADEFFLDCRTAGRLIGVNHTTAWRYLAVLCADGVLKAGEQGSYGSGSATGKASRYRYLDAGSGSSAQ